MEEISAFTQANELRDRLNIVLLSGDDTAKDRDAALRILTKTDWDGRSGFASPQLLDQFDTLQRSLLSHKQRMPVPTSFLIDAQGNLAVIYKGVVTPTQLAADLELCQTGQLDAFAAAVASTGRWFERPDVAAHSQIAIATQFTRQGNPQAAAQYLSAITDRVDPNPLAEEAEARMTLAGAQLNLANEFFRSAKRLGPSNWTRSAIRFAPQFVKAHFNLGVIHQELNDTDSAIEAFESALNIDPNHAYSNFNLGAIYDSTKPELATHFYERAIEADPKFTEARYNLGLLSLRNGELDAARQQFLAVVEDQQHADASYQLGNIALRSQDDTAAIHYFESALSANDQHTDAMTNLASTLFGQQQFDRAVSYLGQVAEIRAGDPKSQFNFGIALLQLKRFDAAIAQFERTIQLQSDHPNAHLRLAQAFVMKPNASKQELSQAVIHAQRSAKSEPATQAAAETLIQQAEALLAN